MSLSFSQEKNNQKKQLFTEGLCLNSVEGGGNKAAGRAVVQSGSCLLPWPGLFREVTWPACGHNLQPAEGEAGLKAGQAGIWDGLSFLPWRMLGAVTPLARLRDNTNQEGQLPSILLLLAYFPRLLPKVNWQLCQIKSLPPPALIMIFPTEIL